MWNEHVSLNTFLFGSFVLGLVIYNNLYTPYKIKEIHSLAAYLFLASILLTQLPWRNLRFGIGFILMPFLGLSLIRDVVLREWLAIFYVFWMIALCRPDTELEWGFHKQTLFILGWFFFLWIGPLYAGLWIETSMAIVLWACTETLSEWYGLIQLLYLYYASILLWILPFCV
jgi:hypothetical protein